MMKHNTLFLEATHDGKCLKIGIYTPGDVIWRYEDLAAPLDKIRDRTHEMLESLNRMSRNGGGGEQALDRLKAFGRMLADELLTVHVKEKIAKTDATYLILKIDDQLVHIPWELICLDQEFLCQRFGMGRLVKTRQDIARSGLRKISRPLKMWILANPRGDLDQAETEGLSIFQDMATMNEIHTIVAPMLDTEISADEVRENLKEYDFVHFAGHVDYSDNDPGGTGWRLSDHHFTVLDVDKMAGGAPMPSLIFSNACQSARTAPWEWKENVQQPSFGLTNAFLRSGVRHYVGAAWEIMDEPSGYFAKQFYEFLRNGGTTGEAVQQARASLLEKYGPDICWASYVLYGDPTVKYFRGERPATSPTPKSQNIPPVSHQSPMTRGSLLNYSLNTTRFKDFQTWLTALLIVTFLSILILGGVFIRQWTQHQQSQSDQSHLLKIQELLITKAQQQQERTHRLFETLKDLIEPLPASEVPPENIPALAMVFDSKTINGPRGKIILHALQDQVLQAQNTFKLLESESFDIVLEELIRNIELTPLQDRKRPNMLTPKLILILEAHDMEATTLVLMRLVNHQTRQVLETEFYELDNAAKILEQKEMLGNKLLQKLKKYETG